MGRGAPGCTSGMGLGAPGWAGGGGRDWGGTLITPTRAGIFWITKRRNREFGEMYILGKNKESVQLVDS